MDEINSNMEKKTIKYKNHISVVTRISMIVSSIKFSSHSQERKKAPTSSIERKYQESNSHYPHIKNMTTCEESNQEMWQHKYLQCTVHSGH